MKMTYDICLVWTAYVIFATVLHLPDGIILQDVDAYIGHLMDNVRNLPFFLSYILFLWFALLWGVLSVLEFYLPWMYSSGFSRFFSMMGN